MIPAGSWRGHLAAFALYLLPSIVFIDHGISITKQVIGTSNDPFIFIWFLAWWPFALSHHLGLFWTDLLWQPVGVSIPWVTSIPGIALPMAPVTLAFGPVVSFNLVMIAAPALDAWAAYALCRRLTGRFAPAALAGFFYGFSAYVMSQEATAMNLSVVICPPLFMLVVWMRLQGALSRPAAILMASGLLILQLGISIEIAAMMLFFGGLTWAVAMVHLPASRAALRRLVVDGLAVGALVAIVLAPVLVAMISTAGTLSLPGAWRFFFTADLADIVIPGPETLWGARWHLTPIRMAGELNELDAYLGLPLLAIIFIYARQTPRHRWLIWVFLALLIASLGPFLWIGGWFSDMAMPWLAFTYLPLLRDAIPARFALFVALAASVIVALFLSQGSARRYLLAAAAMLALLPAPHPVQPVPQSAFFAPGRLQATLGQNPKLLVLPFAIRGPSSYWQVENGFGFQQTAGYVGYPPAPMQRYDAVNALFGGVVHPGLAPKVADFARATGTDFIIIGPGTKPDVAAAIHSLGWPSRAMDDVVVVGVPHG
jgi:hypothetical protein